MGHGGRTLRIQYLADHEDVLPRLAEWFESEWPSYYGPAGPGDAGADLRQYARRDGLPLGFVAFCGGSLCGFAALRADSIATHRHLTPWAAAGLVHPDFRGRGIGTALLGMLEQAARGLGHPRLYCATSTADGLVRRAGWELREEARLGEAQVRIYERRL